MRVLRLATCGCAAAAVLLAMAGCSSDEKVVRYRPFFAGIPDAKLGTAAVAPTNPHLDPALLSDEKLIVHNPDGSTTLVAKTVRQLMRHLERTLNDEKQTELIADQLIATETKRYLQSEGSDAAAYVEYLRECRRDISLFFARMPMGEYSPTVIFEPTGEKQYVVRLTGAATKGVRFTKLWVALEQGNFKLLWLTE